MSGHVSAIIIINPVKILGSVKLQFVVVDMYVT